MKKVIKIAKSFFRKITKPFKRQHEQPEVFPPPPTNGKTRANAKPTVVERAKKTAQEMPIFPFIKPKPPTPEVPPVTPTDVLRYRYHHGVNLGSTFVLEEWLNYSMFFHPCLDGSEHDAVTQYHRKFGLDATKHKWEDHWTDPISEGEFKWLATEAKVTSIRLPIGYFTLGEEWCFGTPFEGVKGVYENAWQKVKDFTSTASRWGIGTLIDFHAVQGGANKDVHSGTSSGEAALWKKQCHQDAATKALVFIAEEIKSGALQGIVGIQLVNEPVRQAFNMYEWYEEVICKIGKVDESIPIYIADAWNLKAALRWSSGRNIFKTRPKNPIVIDTHRYWCHDETSKRRNFQETILNIADQLEESYNLQEFGLSGFGEAEVVVGEWSCVLDDRTWGQVEPDEKERRVKKFGHSQSKKWQERAGGAYFWTYKNELKPEGEWGFETQVRKQNIPLPESLTFNSAQVQTRVETAIIQRGALGRHALTKYGKKLNKERPGITYDHSIWCQGWEVGYSDALEFFQIRSTGKLGDAVQDTGGDKIGCMEIWIKKRLLESRLVQPLVWELEQGYRKGVHEFEKWVGI